ncbi:MAG: hypothetical protein HC919_12850 [Oscillatoriales cyanobacterium SM2_2_1]|nr:hypothetical protein [Oscillatoriales cyanobacterium SM2_2_1]
MTRAKPPSTTTTTTPPSSQKVILFLIAWAALALIFYLFFSAPTEPITRTITADCKAVVMGLNERPQWYRIATYVFQTVAIAISGYLCLRNWQSSKILSGRNVWLGLGLGIWSWGIGNLVFAYLDFTGQPTFPSFPDAFFSLTYIFLSSGMAMSVFGRRLSLYGNQWVIVGAVTLAGMAIAGYVTLGLGAADLDLGKALNILYAVGDIWLLIVATILLLAFWGGKAAQSWRLLGAAGIAMFISDLWFAYINNTTDECIRKLNPNGDPAEFFWILAFVLWGMGAAIEHDLSARSTSRRR